MLQVSTFGLKSVEFDTQQPCTISDHRASRPKRAVATLLDTVRSALLDSTSGEPSVSERMRCGGQSPADSPRWQQPQSTLPLSIA
eukprot:511822-Pleurochrysis_carterae.AAC.1